jgi:hypothetical protein
MDGSRLIPLLNRSTGEGAECDVVGVDVGAFDGTGEVVVVVPRPASDAKRLVYVMLQ